MLSLVLALLTSLPASGAANASDASPPTAAPPKAQRLAILQIAPQGAPTEIAETLTQVVAEQAGRTPGFNAISQSEIAAMLGAEKQRQLLGCSDQSCLAEIAGALGAKLILGGTLGKVGDSYVFQLQLIDAAKAQIVSRESRTVAGPQSELIAVARDLVSRVLTGRALDTTGKIKLVVSPRGAKVVIDGRLVGQAPLDVPVQLEQGTHRVHVEADGYVTFDEGLDAMAGQTLFNEISLVSTRPITEGARHGAQSTLGWVLIGISAAALGVGVYCGVQANDNYDSYKAANYKVGTSDLAGAQNYRNQTNQWALPANIGFATAGVAGLLGVGLEIWALAEGSSQPKRSTEVIP